MNITMQTMTSKTSENITQRFTIIQKVIFSN